MGQEWSVSAYLGMDSHWSDHQMSKYYQRADLHGQESPGDIIVSKGLLNIRLRPVTLGWVSLEDRKPTAEDADNGWLLVKVANLVCAQQVKLENISKTPLATHFHPIAKFAPEVPTFGEWLCALPDYYTSHSEAKVKWMNERLAEYSAKFGGAK